MGASVRRVAVHGRAMLPDAIGFLDVEGSDEQPTCQLKLKKLRDVSVRKKSMLQF